MKQIKFAVPSLVFAALFTVIGVTQTRAQTADVSAEVGDSVIERWQTDPATIFDASEINLSDLAYLARPVVVFADSPNDPRFAEQMALLLSRQADLALRHVIIVTDTNPAAANALRLSLRPHGFALVLIDTDGRVALRKPEPWDVRELTRIIDKMPSRLREIGQ